MRKDLSDIIKSDCQISASVTTSIYCVTIIYYLAKSNSAVTASVDADIAYTDTFSTPCRIAGAASARYRCIKSSQMNLPQRIACCNISGGKFPTGTVIPIWHRDNIAGVQRFIT